MAATKARVQAAQPAPVQTGPAPTDDEALATLMATFPVAWVRKFDTIPNHEGATVYVDRRTGQVYDTLPAMHTLDGLDL